MLQTELNEAQVDRIARDLAPDVIRIRFNIGQDWSEHPAVYFRVILSDAASQVDHLSVAAGKVAARLSDEFGIWESGFIPYFLFRSLSEQVELKEKAWD